MFKEGEIVSRLFIEKKGKMEEIIIRFPRKSDALGIWRFYNKAIKETEFLARITPLTKKEEEKWVLDVITRMKKKNEMLLLVEHNGKIIGSCGITRGNRETMKHIGDYGIAILQNYAGFGLGTKITRAIENLARKEMKLEIIQLHVYHKNKIAQGLYKKLGFKVAGTIPRGVKRKGKYMDNIIMYKVL